jgi:hypothetical protein
MTRFWATTLAFFTLLAAALIVGAAISPAPADAAVPKRFIFPVVGPASYFNDFGAPRSQGSHQGNDILTDWRAIAVATEPGRVRLWTSSARAGCMLWLHGDSGTSYAYIHLNNDLTPKTSDDGGCARGVAYAPGLRDGQRVKAGQHIGYVGDSGDAENGVNHLHFEVQPNGNCCVSPYRWLNRAKRMLFPIPLVGSPAIPYRLHGTVNWVKPADGGSMVAITTTDLAGGDGSAYRITKRLVTWVPNGAIIKKKVKRKKKSVEIKQARTGQRITVWSVPTKPTIAAALAKKNTFVVRKVLLRP